MYFQTESLMNESASREISTLPITSLSFPEISSAVCESHQSLLIPYLHFFDNINIYDQEVELLR